jgi:hypothetical protein
MSIKVACGSLDALWCWDGTFVSMAAMGGIEILIE